jgi:hypothetical protein
MFTGPNISTDGLKSHIDISSDKCFTGTGSGIIADLSGNGLHWEWPGELGYEESIPQGVIMYGNSYIRIQDESGVGFMSASDFSVITVFRCDGLEYPDSAHPLKLGHTMFTTQSGWSVGHRDSQTEMEIRVGNGIMGSVTPGIGIATPLIENSKFYHRVFTVSRDVGTLTKFYLNADYMGELDSPYISGSIYNPTVSDVGDSLMIGNVWGWRYSGSIAVVKVYDRVLSEEEIREDYNSYRYRFGI